jgi:hypothetical protein
MIYTDDHVPSHVHVFNAEGEVVIHLGTETEAPSIREVNGMRRRHVRVALEIVTDNQALLIDIWRRIHG